MDAQKQAPEQLAQAGKSSNGPLFGVIGVMILAVVGFFATQLGSKPDAQASSQGTNHAIKDQVPATTPIVDDQSSQTTPVTPDPTTTPVATAASYKNGTYDATGNYNSPAGPEQIDVKVTLKNNVITNADVTSLASNPKSMRMQGMFVDNFKPMVVGQNIDTLELTKVSGSSLTPIGFNDALAKIKAQAKA